MSRIPLVATVVGALLIGGATTGGTLASWSNQRQLHAQGVQSGQLSFTATSPDAVAVDKTAGSTADSTFVLDDTSTGKNNRQRITASVAGTPAGITATIGTSCATATTASVAVDTTPTSANQNLCVRVTVTNQPTTAVSGNVTVNISGAQRPTGWSTPSSTVTMPVTVNTPAPAAPVLSCLPGAQGGGQYRFSWTSVPGAWSYAVYRSDTPAGPFNAIAWPVFATNYQAAHDRNDLYYYRVAAVVGLQQSPMSGTLELGRRGNSQNWDCEVT